MQPLPPLAGLGSLHSRVDQRNPTPHVTLHLPGIQSDHPPFTVYKHHDLYYNIHLYLCIVELTWTLDLTAK